MVSDRPAEAADRAVPGHWEGDLIVGQPEHVRFTIDTDIDVYFCCDPHSPNPRSVFAKSTKRSIASASVASVGSFSIGHQPRTPEGSHLRSTMRLLVPTPA